MPDQRGPGRPVGQSGRVRPGLPHALPDRLRRRARRPRQCPVSLSPQDLAAYDLIPRLIELGVASLKIEGPAQVAGIRRQHHAPLPRGDRRGLGRAARRVHAAATSRKCSSRFREASPTVSWTATTTRSWSAATTPRSGASCLGVVESVTRAGVRLRPSGPGQAGRRPGLRRRRSDWPPRAGRPHLRGHARGRPRRPKSRIGHGRAAVRPRRDRPRRGSRSASGSGRPTIPS